MSQPGKPSNRTPGAPKEMEIGFLSCPKGHKLPHKTDRGECSPVFCPGFEGGGVKMRAAKLAKQVVKAISAEADEVIESAPLSKEGKEIAVTAKGELLGKLSQAHGRQAARKTFFKVPPNLQGADAEAWAQQKAVSLLPEAMAELEYQLMLGDDAQRRDAARDILDINGMRKRESSSGGGATIILNLGGKELPWAQRVVEKLEGEKVNVPKTEET